MYEKEVVSDGFVVSLCSACVESTCVDHLGGLLLQIFWLHVDLRGEVDHAIASACEQSIHKFGCICPAWGLSYLLVSVDLVYELDNAFPSLNIAFGFLFCGQEESAYSVVVTGCLCEGFCYDRWLMEFNPKSEVNNRVKEAYV